MKPRELYSGPAPAAMAEMGQGISEAGARIGQMQQQGYAAMGQGLAQGIQGAAAAYGDYKKMQSQVKSDSAAFDALKDYMPKEIADKFDTQRQAIENDPKASLLDKQAFYNSAKSFLGTSMQHSMDMQKADAQIKGQMEIAKMNPAFTTAPAQANMYYAQAEALGRKNMPFDPYSILPGERTMPVSVSPTAPSDVDEGIYQASPFGKKFGIGTAR